MMNSVIHTNNAPAAVGPYSQGIKAGNTIYVSGQLAINPATGELYKGGDIKEETRMSLMNVKAILEEAGATLMDVVKCTVFIKDMNQFGLINEAYAEVFQDTKPARVCVEVA
ncbi:MAG TPA: Rid family detoxifying hydrolase, partial [Sedimentibacter sp.]|nr:Rid family detoxifying hydrolase [Sedimentibacter sp.]